jgi:hypothetical protein
MRVWLQFGPGHGLRLRARLQLPDCGPRMGLGCGPRPGRSDTAAARQWALAASADLAAATRLRPYPRLRARPQLPGCGSAGSGPGLGPDRSRPGPIGAHRTGWGLTAWAADHGTGWMQELEDTPGADQVTVCGRPTAAQAPHSGLRIHLRVAPAPGSCRAVFLRATPRRRHALQLESVPSLSGSGQPADRRAALTRRDGSPSPRRHGAPRLCSAGSGSPPALALRRAEPCHGAAPRRTVTECRAVLAAPRCTAPPPRPPTRATPP